MNTKKLVSIATLALAALNPMMAASVHGDPCGGAGIGAHIVSAGSNRSFCQCFRGGEVGRVTVEGDGDTDLDLFVYDEMGRLVGSDTDNSDFCVVTFYTPYPQNYRIVIRNLGGVYNRFVIRVD